MLKKLIYTKKYINRLITFRNHLIDKSMNNIKYEMFLSYLVQFQFCEMNNYAHTNCLINFILLYNLDLENTWSL